MLDAGSARSVVVTTADRGAPVMDGVERCTNCGGGPVARFCAACGQRHVTPHDFTTLAFLRETLNEFISLDGRFGLTLWTLVRYPGKLAREYFDGRGARYMRPLNLFLLLNLVFFIVQPHTGLLQWHLQGYVRGDRAAQALVDRTRLERAQAAERDREAHGARPAPARLESMEVFEAEFESTIQNLKKSMLLVAIPLFALLLGIAYGGQRRLAEHLVFSTHFYAYSVFTLTVVVQLVFMSAVGWLQLLRAPRAAYVALNGETPLTVVLFALLGGYLYAGLRRMHGDARLAATVRAIVLFTGYQAMVILFAVAMFRVTLWAM